MNKKQIIQLLARIGISSVLKGYRYLVHIIFLAISQNENSYFLLKDLYTATADYFQISSSCVQRSVRTLLDTYWNEHNIKHFSAVVGYPVFHPLPPKEFVAVIVDYMQTHQN